MDRDWEYAELIGSAEIEKDRPRDAVWWVEAFLIGAALLALLVLALVGVWLFATFVLSGFGWAAAVAAIPARIRADVRNPLLSLPGVAQLKALPIESQVALRKVLKSISADARARAEKCWRTHKAPMAAYWKAVAVYANHTSRLLKGGA